MTQKSNKQIVEEIKEVLNGTVYFISYRNRSGREYVTMSNSNKYTWDIHGFGRDLDKIVYTAFPAAHCTSGCSYNKTYRINS